MYKELFANRLSALRTQKNVSARKMSRMLGQADNYINNIENRKTYPSMTGFLNICDYFGITPKEFFDEGTAYPERISRLIAQAQMLTEAELDTVLALLETMNTKKR